MDIEDFPWRVFRATSVDCPVLFPPPLVPGLPVWYRRGARLDARRLKPVGKGTLPPCPASPRFPLVDTLGRLLCRSGSIRGRRKFDCIDVLWRTGPGHGRFMLRMGSPLHEAVESGITDCAYGAACVHLVLFPVESNYCFKLANGLRIIIGAPLVASMFLLLATIGAWLWARRKGDAWFRA